MSVWGFLEGSPTADTLKAQIASTDVPHAWLLLGPGGSGKHAAASAIAAALNCRTAPFEGCGKCSVCLRVLRRRFPDVHHIVPEGPLIPVDVVRESIIPEAARSTFEGTHKVFVIHEAERMNPAAQNALLKTLEEPQPNVVFVLISDQEEELLDTIRSRCRVVRLESVPHRRIVELLVREGAAPEVADLAARLHSGDLDGARRLALEEQAQERRRLWLSLPHRLTGPVDVLDAAAEVVAEGRQAAKEHEAAQKAEVVELADAMGEGRGTAGARNALIKRHKRELRRVEEDVLGDCLHSLASFYRDALALRTGAEVGLVNVDVLPEIRAWAAAEVDDAALIQVVEALIATRGSLTLNANVPLAIESALLGVARFVPPAARVGSASTGD